MDAGLAAVLGAAVGAVGTGGAGIVAALLTRSQARSQLKAEYARFIREPRKAAYAAYVEAAVRDHSKLSEAAVLLKLAAEQDAGTRTSDRITRARAAYEVVDSNTADFEHLYAQVAVEGPEPIIGAAVLLSGALTEYAGQVLACLHSLARDGNCSSEAIELLDERHSESYDAYLGFLRRASEVLGVDGITRA
ncbi:hypothetical protein ACF1G5_15530 [Streptomyces coeruleorubidus]|uniref:hypothetical protein n=1 Tax=Streptomyces coeruleorubidus TaxID=116188 RepID=UPI0036F54F65